MSRQGLVGIGLLEYRDVIGSIQYARSRKETAGMQLGLLSRCLGANPTIVAMSRHPEYFEDVRALVAVQPVSARPFIERASEQAGIEEGASLFDTRIKQLTGFALDELSPIQYAKDVKVPTLVAQVHDDVSTRPEDVQTIYDNLGSPEKDLLWIEGTTRRFDGYNYFGEHPERMLNWFDLHFLR
jgi:esterase/lipase